MNTGHAGGFWFESLTGGHRGAIPLRAPPRPRDGSALETSCGGRSWRRKFGAEHTAADVGRFALDRNCPSQRASTRASRDSCLASPTQPRTGNAPQLITPLASEVEGVPEELGRGHPVPGALREARHLGGVGGVLGRAQGSRRPRRLLHAGAVRDRGRVPDAGRQVSLQAQAAPFRRRYYYQAVTVKNLESRR